MTMPLPTNCYNLPELGTLWSDDRHGLMMIVDIVPLGSTGFDETLYMFHVLRLRDTFHTTGIFSSTDWHTKFKRVA